MRKKKEWGCCWCFCYLTCCYTQGRPSIWRWRILQWPSCVCIHSFLSHKSWLMYAFYTTIFILCICSVDIFMSFVRKMNYWMWIWILFLYGYEANHHSTHKINCGGTSSSSSWAFGKPRWLYLWKSCVVVPHPLAAIYYYVVLFYGESRPRVFVLCRGRTKKKVPTPLSPTNTNPKRSPLFVVCVYNQLSVKFYLLFLLLFVTDE